MSFKIVAIVGGVIAAVPLLLVVGLLLAGLRANRANHAEVVIHAPAAEVWRHLEDPALVKGWVGGLVEIEPLTHNATTAEVGVKDRMIVEVNGQRNELFSEITAVERHRSLAQRVTAEKGLPFTEHMTFTLEEQERGQHTKFVIDATWEYTTWAGRLLEPVIAKIAQKKVEEDLARLKTNVERT